MVSLVETHMNGAELLVRMLHAYGVRHVFGVPGDTNVSFYEALESEAKLFKEFT